LVLRGGESLHSRLPSEVFARLRKLNPQPTPGKSTKLHSPEVEKPNRAWRFPKPPGESREDEKRQAQRLLADKDLLDQNQTPAQNFRYE